MLDARLILHFYISSHAVIIISSTTISCNYKYQALSSTISDNERCFKRSVPQRAFKRLSKQGFYNYKSPKPYPDLVETAIGVRNAKSYPCGFSEIGFIEKLAKINHITSEGSKDMENA